MKIHKLAKFAVKTSNRKIDLASSYSLVGSKTRPKLAKKSSVAYLLAKTQQRVALIAKILLLIPRDRYEKWR